MSTIFDVHSSVLADYRDFVPSFFSLSLTNGRGPLVQRVLGKGSSFRGHELL
jgi:hypothetical protein